MSGNFWVSSTADEGSTGRISYAEKRRQLHAAANAREEYLKSIDGDVKKAWERNCKQIQVFMLKKRLAMVKEILLVAKEKRDAGQEEYKQSVALKERLKSNVEQIKKKAEKLVSSSKLLEKKEKLKRYKEKLAQKNVELKEVRRSHVDALVTFIFPISTRTVYPQFGTPPRATIQRQDSCSEVVAETMSTAEVELQEATRTVHVGGEWVSNAEQTQHCVLEAWLPSNGDLMKYYEWLKSYRNEPRGPDSHSRIYDPVILGIPAALLYTAQLTDALSYFLAVNIPHSIDYTNFAEHQTSRRKLFLTVNNLMENVMFLCFSQLVPEENLDPCQPLSNLQHCVSMNNPHLGWCDSFETYDFSVRECPFDSDDSTEELDFDAEGESVSCEQEEWDRLMDLPTDPREIQSETPSPVSERDRSLSASASGLVTSAAASVAALWSWKRQ